MDLDTIIKINNGWQALVLLAIIVVPQVMAYLKGRQTKAAVAGLEHTLNETNSGSTVRDALNRIEARQQEQGEVLDAVETRLTVLEEGGATP